MTEIGQLPFRYHSRLRPSADISGPLGKIEQSVPCCHRPRTISRTSGQLRSKEDIKLVRSIFPALQYVSSKTSSCPRPNVAGWQALFRASNSSLLALARFINLTRSGNNASI